MKKDDTVPQPPQGLCSEAKSFWYEVVENWELEPSERELLRVTCWSLHRFYEAKKIMDKEGCVVDTGNIPRKHPALEVEKVSRTGFLQALKALKLEMEGSKRPVGRPPGTMS